MKNYAWITLLFGWTLWTGCSNDFDLTDEYKDIPVVYGLMNNSLDTQFLRIEKAFLDESTSALEIARISDSIFYQNLNVRIEQLSGGDDDFTLQRVDGNQIGYERQQGVFAEDPNYLYILPTPDGEKLAEGEQYRLVLERGDQLPLVTATTTIVGTPKITNPDMPRALNYSYANVNSRQRPVWKAAPGANFYQFRIQFNIAEYPKDNPNDVTHREINWLVESNLRSEPGNNSLSVNIPNVQFYQFLGNELEANSDLVRILKSYDYVVLAGGDEIAEYLLVNQANKGITSSQTVTTFSNLSEGFGIFSSTNEARLNGLRLNPESSDSLRNGIYTKDLGFL